MRAVFLDRDGTITVGTPTFERVDSLDKVVLQPHTIEALTLLKALDFEVFIVTNQAGISERLMTMSEFEAIHQKVLDLIAPSGITIVDTLLCPHQESDHCECRKPSPKLLIEAAVTYNLDLPESWIIGDRPTDVQTGVHAGTQSILVRSGTPDASDKDATYTCNDLLEAVQYLDRIENE